MNKMIVKCTAIMSIAFYASANDCLIYSDAELEIIASNNTTFAIQSQYAFGFAFAAFQAGDCLCVNYDDDLEGDVHPSFVNIVAEACCGGDSQANDCNTVASTEVQSSLSTSSTSISWQGFLIGQGGAIGCDLGFCLNGGAYGFHVEFTADGNFDITPPDCPDPSLIDDSIGRRVFANIVCLSSGPIFSSLTQHGSRNVDICNTTPITMGNGSYTLDFASLIIDDSEDDITGDGRFNQDDVDYLTSISPTISSTYTSRFDYDSDGDVDGADIAVLQCFVDACLDARRLGDADCDNDVDCDDLTAVVAQAFAGEAFDDAATTYKVGFDADLDGDNDAFDKAALRDVFLAVEPANFKLDGSINFFDNSEFLMLYNASDPRADMNGDGNFNFFDVSIFLQNYDAPTCLPAP